MSKKKRQLPVAAVGKVINDEVDAEIIRRQNEAILNTDALTMIPNRNGFYSDTSVLLCEHPDKDYVICCINVDKFKLVNDLFGIQEGDRLLMYMADKLRDYAWETGTYGRLTADNFAMCIPDEEGIYNKVTTALKEWFEDYDIPINVVTRCGFYHVHDADVEVGLMCDRANLAIQEIKGSYDRSYGVYDENIRRRIIQEQEILNEMKIALDNRQFTVYYQPKFNMETGKLIGSEALVRWIHPEKGIISPGIFVPIFEKNGFISALDQYVWESVCRDLREWLDNGYAVCPVSINVSRAELYNKGLSQFLVNLVEKYRIPQQYVQLEITESAYTDDPDQIIKMVKELKSKGFVILMDDFGSGYSSLNTLKDVPVDVLKLDLKFLYNMDHNLKANYILKSVVQMAMRLDLVVIAEGVETETQAEFLRSIGCIRAQGYLYAKPMPKSELELFLKDPEKVSEKDEDTISGIVNINDVMEGFHTDDVMQWYKLALVQLKALLYEYDIENDMILIFDMKLEEGESEELPRLEIGSFLKRVKEGGFIYDEDVPVVTRMIEERDVEPCDLRLRGIGGTASGFGWFRQEGRVLTTADGTPKSIVGIIRDISDEKMEEALLEILSTFENEENESFLMIRVLSAITRGVASRATGILITKSRKFTDLGGIIVNNEGDREVIMDGELMAALDEELKTLETNELGIAILNVDDFYSYGPKTQDMFFAHNESVVAVYRTQISEWMSAIFFTTYKTMGKRFTSKSMRHLGEIFKSVRNNLDKMYSNKFERENNEMYSLAFNKAGTRLWEWDVETGTLHRMGKAIPDDGIGEWVPNAPDVFVYSHMIHPDYVDDCLEAYKKLRNGEDALVMVKKQTQAGIYEWVHIDYSVITDENGDPVKAIGIGEDVNQLREKQLRVREHLLRRRMSEENVEGSWFTVDLDANRVLDTGGNLIIVQRGDNYDGKLDRMCYEHVLEEDRERFLNANRRELLLKRFHGGENCLFDAYRYRDNEGIVHKRALNIDLTKTADGTIEALIRNRSMDSTMACERFIEGDIGWDDEFGMYDEDSFKQMIKGVMRHESEKKGALYIIDLDRYTIIKDNLGSKYAKELVKDVVSIIKAVMPDEAIFGLLLEDRFGVFIPEYKSMRDVFNYYRDTQKMVFSAFTMGTVNYILSCSIGLSYTEHYNGDFEKLYAETMQEMLNGKLPELTDELREL